MSWVCSGRKPVFATAPYEPDEGGVLRVVLPERCPLAGPAEACSVYFDHHRPRKTGPRFPLAVAGCSVHRPRRFTLYPPGHIPYGRVQVVPCSASGALLRDGESGELAWEDSLCAAAVDAAERERWSAESRWDDARRRRTQGRRLDVIARLLGVHPALSEGERERIATRLGVPTLALRSAAGRWARSWITRGAAVLTILVALPVDGTLLDRVLAAGAVTGLWAAPQRWDPARASWIRPGSAGPVSASDRGSSSRDPPPTNSQAPPSSEPL